MYTVRCHMYSLPQIATGFFSSPQMGKLPTSQPLRSKRKVQQVTVRTPPQDMRESDSTVPDMESSYFSICYLLQTENEVSAKLVIENQVLSQILEKLQNGCPRDVEQLSLNALASALSWAPSQVLEELLRLGLLDYCFGILQRPLGPRSTNDPSIDSALELMRDLVYLDDRVSVWVLDHIADFLTLLQSSHVALKRGASRLIYALVEVAPAAFVPSHPETRLTPSQTSQILSLFSCPDIETSCFITMSGLILECLYGSSVVPAVANMQLDLVGLIRTLSQESTTFATTPSDEVEFRLNIFRSQLRGVSSFLELIADGIVDLVDEKDSIEDRIFTVVSANDKIRKKAELSIVSKLANIDWVAMSTAINTLSGQLVSTTNEDEEEDIPATSSHPPSLLDDQDAKNIFCVVGTLVKLDKYIRFRFGGSDLGGFDQIQTVVSTVLVSGNSDLSAVAECLGWISAWFLASLAGKSTVVVTDQTVQPMVPILAKIARMDVDGLNEDQVGVFLSFLEIVQEITLMSPNNVSVRTAVANILMEFIGNTVVNVCTKTQSDPLMCAIAETMFVVFGEDDLDGILNSGEWKSAMDVISSLLSEQLRGSKSVRNERNEYIQGTVENIAAFIAYKQRK
jgi:hypothetical protein